MRYNFTKKKRKKTKKIECAKEQKIEMKKRDLFYVHFSNVVSNVVFITDEKYNNL